MYETVYEIGGIPEGVGHGGLFLCLGIGVLALGWRLIKTSPETPFKNWGTVLWGVLAMLGGGVGLVVTLRAQHVAWSAYSRGEVEIVEGKVSVLREQPEEGHAAGDLIEVGGHELEVNYFEAGPGYHLTIAHDGVLRDGTTVRLLVHHGHILKLDVKLLEAAKVRALLERLCTRLDLCLPEATQRRLEQHPPPSVRQFADAVLSASGLIPANVPSDLDRSLHDEVAKAFAEAGQ